MTHKQKMRFGGKITMKSLWVLAFVALLSVSFVFAAIDSIDYGARCDIVRSATEFRPEKTWYGIGIYGRLSDGSLTCFLP